MTLAITMGQAFRSALEAALREMGAAIVRGDMTAAGTDR